MLELNIRDFWKGRLKQWTAASLQDAEVPSSAKKFLIEVGMPSNTDWTLQFESPAKTAPRLANASGVIVIGHDGPVPLCIREGARGHVACVESWPDRVRFVNSNVMSLGAFLVFYQKYRLAVRGMDEDEADRLIDATEAEMLDCDSQAMDNPEHYWATILEQMRDGLL